MENKYGLIGKSLGHSFSKFFFESKFKSEKLSYHNIELDCIEKFLDIDICQYKGFNVTIPYKEKIIPYLDKCTTQVNEIKAVNTIQIKGALLIGHNTDVYGFEVSLRNLIKENSIKKALILGSGGSARAVGYVLDSMQIEKCFVSRKLNKNIQAIKYEDITRDMLEEYKLIINCTPLGMYPKIHEFPQIPYQYINSTHFAFDLIYNPSKSLFLKKSEHFGATICNGLEMLKLQALKSYEIWKC